MIPFDLETWKANPDCEVYYVHDNHLIEELTYFPNTRLNQFCGVVSETRSLELYSGDELMLKLPETNHRPYADVIRAYADGQDVYYDEGIVETCWVLFEQGKDILIHLGDPSYEWHIGKPEE